MIGPEPTLTLMSIVCAACDRPLCAEVCARHAEEHQGEVVHFEPIHIGQLLQTASLNTMIYHTEHRDVPPYVLDCVEAGRIVLAVLKPDQDHSEPWYAFLHSQDATHTTLLALGDTSGTIFFDKPIAHYTTGDFIIVLERADLERGFAAARQHGILV